ncbi:ESCRT-II subunit protein snf8 [Chamberlinius hualienensis]
MHRRAGVGAIHKQKLQQAKYKDKGTELAADQLTEMSKQLSTFRDKLGEFATKHKNDIRKDPQFRSQFQEMCASIGVDPLASGKGFWSEVLGVGDFYYELGVQIIEVCLSTSHRNGGLMYLDELKHRLISSRPKSQQQDISTDDLLRAIKKLKVLGSGFTVIPMKNRYLVQSIPGEFSMDHTTVLQLAEGKAYISVNVLKEQLSWQDDRATRALDFLVHEGLAWIDDQAHTRLYWFPGLFVDN